MSKLHPKTGLSNRARRPTVPGWIRFAPSASALLLASLCCVWFASHASGQSANPTGDAASPDVPQQTHATTAHRTSTTDDAAANEDRDLRAEQLSAATALLKDIPGSDAAFVMGLVLNEQGNLDAAIAHWEAELKPGAEPSRLHDRADALANLGEALKAKGDLDRAAKAFEGSLALNPKRPSPRFQLAHIRYAQGDPEACLNLLNAGKQESAKTHHLRGQALQKLGKDDEARQSYETAARLDDTMAEAFYGLASIHAKSGDEQKAAECRQRFAELKSRHQTAGREMRTRYNPLEITKRSLSQTHTEVGWVYSEKGLVAKAEALWLRAVAADPDNTACRFHLVMLYQKQGRNEDALAQAREMVRAEPKNAFHHIGMGNLLARLKRGPEAEEAFNKAIALAPERPEGYFALAQLYLRTESKTEDALRLAKQAVTIAPAPPHYFVLSQAQAKAGDRAGAIASIDRAREMDPKNPQYQRQHVTLLPGSN